MRDKLQLAARTLCIFHALSASGLWYIVVILDSDVVSVTSWLDLTVAWVVWIPILAIASKPRRRWSLAALALGLAVLSPTFSTLYAFAMWSIGGFAP